MANRIIMKKSPDEYGNEKHAHEWIKDYLSLEGEKRFGEIKQYLSDHGIRYANDKGFDLALKSLIKSGDIGKHRIAGKPFPVYYLKKKWLNRIASIAQEFRRAVVWDISKHLGVSSENSESDEKYLIKNLIHIYGLYNLYVQIKSWSFTSNKKSHSENYDIRRTWLRHTLPLGSESYLLEEGIKDLVDLRFYSTTAEYNESISRLYANEKKWKKLLELEKLLKKMYPDEIEFFDSIMTRSPDEAKKTKEWIREVQRHEAWKKRIIRKNAKNPKKNLKPNQCPVCYYDGTSKVKAGQCKGMIFPAGYVNEVTNEEGEHWHCPACGHWDIKKIA